MCNKPNAMTEKVSYTKRTAQGIGIVFFMNILANFFGYLIRMILARNLTTAEYGLFYSVFTFVLFFMCFINFGLPLSLAKFISEFRAKESFNAIKTTIVSGFFSLVSAAVVVSLILFLLSGYLAEHYFKNPDAEIILKVLLVYIVTTAFGIVCGSSLIGFQKFAYVALLDAMKNLIVLLWFIVLFYLGMKSATAAALAYAGGHILLLLFIKIPFLVTTFTFNRYRIENCMKMTKSLFAFGLPLVAGAIAARLIGHMDTLVLTGTRTLTEVGIYNVILPSALLFVYLGGAVNTVLLPVTSELKAKNDEARLSEGLRLVLQYSFVIIIPLLLIVFTYSAWFIELMFGNHYVSGVPAFRILLIGVMFCIVAQINNTVLSGIGKPMTVSKIIIGAATINFICNCILVPRFGIIGAAAATAFSYFVIFSASTIMAARNIRVSLPRFLWLKLIFAGGVFAAIAGTMKHYLLFTPWIEIPLTFACALTIFLLVVWMMKILHLEEIKLYLRGIRK